MYICSLETEVDNVKITPRMKQIFRALLEEKEPISIKHLAEKTGISKRTVQRDRQSV